MKNYGDNWFTIARAFGSFTVYGDIGTPPLRDTFVIVTGIVAEKSGPNGEQYLIRVRGPLDIASL